MEPNIEEVAGRIRALREDLDITSAGDGRRRRGARWPSTPHRESGQQDLSFTFLYKCAQRLGVDVIELLTGEDPHLSGYSLTRAAEGLSIKRRAGFEYLHKAPHFKNKLAEPFLVTAPYLEEEQDAPIHLSCHKARSSTTSSPAACASPTRIISKSSRRAIFSCTIPAAATA